MSDPREIVSVPESDDIFKSVDIPEVDTDVTRPFPSILKTGIAVEDP